MQNCHIGLKLRECAQAHRLHTLYTHWRIIHNAKVCAVVPVSYTHLDVYKRQVPRR